MSTLYGSWFGELGWIVAFYAPAMRAASRRHGRCVIALDESLSYLVEDFAETVALKCEGHAQHTGRVLEGKDRLEAMLAAGGPEDETLTGRDAMIMAKSLPLEHFRYGSPRPRVALPFYGGGGILDEPPPGCTPMAGNVVCFFRAPKPLSAGRGDPLRKSYPEPMAEELVRLLAPEGPHVVPVGCAGGLDNLHYPPAADMRGAPLWLLCEVLAKAKCAVGPSSGTMHLAQRCGCPVVTWTDGHANVRRRYELAPPAGWNAFGTRTIYMGNANPEPRAVAEEIWKLCGN